MTYCRCCGEKLGPPQLGIQPGFCEECFEQGCWNKRR